MQEKIRQILDLLKREYGVPEQQHRPDPVSVLVRTILSQNTSDTNSRAAFQSLLASFDSWEDIGTADISTIANCIRCGGLGTIKAQRLKQALEEIIRERGRLELDFLTQLTPSGAEDWLQRLPGVGPKTARCVLLFSLGTPVLPVDTHILRVTKRLGLIGPKASPREAHYALGGAVSPEDIYPFHILVIEHGRTTCRARYPDCQACVLRKMCPSYGL